MVKQLFRITLLILGWGCLLVPASSAGQSIDEKHLEVSLRMIGHRVLLSAGDSTSRVLPIEQEDGQYIIRVEPEFGFIPEDLVMKVNEVFEKANIDRRYIMQVVQCESGEVVYSFEMDNQEHKVIIPCQSRVQPKSCYELHFTFQENDQWPNGGITQTEGRSEKERSRSMVIFGGFMLGLVVVGGMFYWKRKTGDKTAPHVVKIGNYYFDQRNAVLILKEQRTELTGKEADLLQLLYNSANSTVERESILQAVWGDEGDYVGRTLDVFISKLRKKLESDPGVKIVNVRGVGYRLIIDR